MTVEAPLEVGADRATIGTGPHRSALQLAESSGQAPPARGLTLSPSVAWRETAVVTSVPLLSLVICIAATRTNILVPQSVRPLNTVGMGGIFNLIGFPLLTVELLPLMAALVVAYLFAIRFSERVSARTVIAAVVALNLVVVLAPPLFSTDMFSYQAYARMFAVYHVNPYTHGPWAISLDPLYPFIGAQWYQTPSDYGPLFTLLSAPLAWVSPLASEVTFKVVGGLCMAATLRLVWKAAALRGVSQVRALAVVGLSPLVMVSGVGGGHNDSLMLLLMVAGVYAFMTEHDRPAGALLAASMSVKLTGGVVMPFALVARLGSDAGDRRRRLLSGVVGVGALVAAASFVFFGLGALQMFSTLRDVQAQGAWQSVPGFFLTFFKIHPPNGVRYALDAVLLGIMARLMRAVWRQRLDWIEAAAWSSFWLLVTAWSILPWYVMLMMPLVALAKDRRLWRAGVAMSLISGIMLVAESVPGGVPLLHI